jgi:demethylmenaquinone methyltransferase/2-methoxy-6-polyprenyl-1,4-benzoquinol methylase
VTLSDERFPDLPQRVFAPIAGNYDRPALLLSLFQYRRWHRFLLSRVDLNDGAADGRPRRVLDMATGTGALALDLLSRPGVEVIGADATRPMLVQAQARAGRQAVDGRLNLVECTAEAAPFTEGSFNAVVSAYLLRYVGDVGATLRSLARLVRPGGMLASLDFAVPHWPVYPLWRAYTDVGLPVGGWLFSPAWRRTGSFLGPNIRDFYRRWPEKRLLGAWRDAGLVDVQSRRLTLGGAIVIWGRRPS